MPKYHANNSTTITSTLTKTNVTTVSSSHSNDSMSTLNPVIKLPCVNSSKHCETCFTAYKNSTL